MTKTFFEWGDASAHGPAGFVNNARLSRKVRTPFLDHDATQADNQRIFAAVKESCERLQTDYVDVFQVGLIDVEGS